MRSIKRKMGGSETVQLGDRTFRPQEISALILRELAEAARRHLGKPVRRAVITVPAYFSDAQRAAAREAGALAGLEVERILNEPTAASLAHGFGETGPSTVLVYDLGGGTFDVSVVRNEQGVTEALASHGNNRLGGDDFDELLLQRLATGLVSGYDGIAAAFAAKGGENRMKELRVELPRDLPEERLARVRRRVLETIIIDMWQAKELSTREAAELLGMTYREYLDLLGYYRVPVTKISADETLASMLEEVGQERAS